MLLKQIERSKRKRIFKDLRNIPVISSMLYSIVVIKYSIIITYEKEGSVPLLEG